MAATGDGWAADGGDTGGQWRRTGDGARWKGSDDGDGDGDGLWRQTTESGGRRG
ncbi:unnamed protein product [Spirodela intermedia]|uniref:Uncharacterized protein n=2 Tax=Spirodela intermedia TaxID=51605 RepID=A0A7I8ILJ6_SPIIN|nr:unnamed protein product [Spirodela intermedia]CAA6657821.1 unnamed protein product [Spirodela intermedia]CAA6674889.1 unnamed protein product [Spirodela intermedia]CAA7393948.1 unnamed protein product [Spirodela intermedia]